VPCIRADCTYSGVSTKLCVIIHNFAHQLLASATVFAIAATTSSVSIVSGSPVVAGYSAKIVDQFDHHAMKARSFLLISLF
jgi:hypothetical protein